MIKKTLKRILNKILYNDQDKPEVRLLYYFRNDLKDFKTVFDIGTYHGNFVDLLLSKNNDLNVHCFEPTADTFRFLSEKYKEKKNIVLNNVAVSNYKGESEFNINSYSETNSLLESSTLNNDIDQLTANISKQKVNIISLTEYIENYNIDEVDLIKIDSQGNTYYIIEGLRDKLLNKKIKYLYVEVEFIEIYKNEKLFSEVNYLLDKCGYVIIDIFNLNYINNKLAWCDVLYSKNNA